MIHVVFGVSLLFLTFHSLSAEDLFLNGPECGISDPSRRIVNGKAAQEDQFPWMVFLRVHFPGQATRCGGSIITKRHVLTAGHCTLLNDEEAVTIDAIYGSNDINKGTKLRVMKMLRHPQFDPAKFHNDIALLLVDKPFEYGSSARPICLPSQPVNIFNSDVMVAGWGFLEQDGKAVDYLRYTVVKVVPNARCADKFQHTGYKTELMYCAYRLNTDACQGDSGGPLMTRVDDGRYVQVGIVSYGIGCALDDMPGVYARLETFVPWMMSYIDKYASYKDLKMSEPT
ncbi:venom protease-like [Amblyomma americanum]